MYKKAKLKKNQATLGLPSKAHVPNSFGILKK
jgi:hypothetical protein